MASVHLEEIVKDFGSVRAVDRVSVTVDDGEFLVLLGPSGCGKSTLLRVIAGLESPTSGRIYVDGREVTQMRPRDRNIAMVFQDYALYPHMSVRDNISFGLRMSKVPRREIAEQVDAIAEMLEIGDLLQRKPHQLSGGQRQRVAIGRALARRPQVFLLDEPLSNLDAQLRVQMRLELQRLHQRLGITTVYVTHDQVEAMTLASRIMVLAEGQTQQLDAPQDIYDVPKNVFVARFVGSPPMNLIPADMLQWDALGIDLRVALPGLTSDRPDSLLVGLRPEEITLLPPGTERDGARCLSMSGVLERLEPIGPHWLATVRLANGGHVQLLAPPRLSTVPDEEVAMTATPFLLRLYDQGSGDLVGCVPMDAAAPHRAPERTAH